MKENSTNKTFLLIDGNAILYRAYHALPPLTKNGVVVNAVYGFFSMLFKIIDEVKPQYIAVCFDRPKPTFRQALYVGYHANRPKMADDLIPQVGIVHDVLQTMHIPIFEVDGYEGDDLIGTLARQGAEINTNTTNVKYQISNKEKKSIGLLDIGNLILEIIILSGDRDMLQLVNPHVKVLMPITGISTMKLFDEEAVKEKYGITPKQFIDYKALIGDPSDNYPGVTGIGPKTASTLLQKYETFENLYEHVSELSERAGKMLATDAEQAALAKKLATILTDAPITLDVALCDVSLIDADDIKAAFEKLDFTSLQKRIPKQIIQYTEDKKKKNESQQLGLL